ncbi:MAG: hypothetical protein HFI90_04375 [Clostridia bacterium]|nr:hypothetical protein [Clostridia bacterium]
MILWTWILAAGGLAAAGAGYGILEAKSLRVRRITITGAPASLHGKTAAAFSDVHFGRFVTLAQLRRCVEKINGLRPDYLWFLGDFSDKHRSHYDQQTRTAVAKLLRGCAPQAEKLAVLGNNDLHMPAACAFSAELLAAGGFRVLQNEAVRLTEDASVIGLEEWKYGKPDVQKALNGAAPYVICLMHHPDYADISAQHQIPVQLSGHSHGGQVKLPLLYRYMLPHGGRKYHTGEYQVGATRLIISNGVGVHTLPFRFLAPPDILHITFTE